MGFLIFLANFRFPTLTPCTINGCMHISHALSCKELCVMADIFICHLEYLVEIQNIVAMYKIVV